MCINFFWQNECYQEDSYSFILANNRDEYWDKPTKEAHFWGPDEFCLSGRDEVPGHKGGTWLGMNKNGKVAVLINILGESSKGKKGRGFLVSDFISSDMGIDDYALSLENEMEKYRGFNLLLFDLNPSVKDFGIQKPVCVTNATIYPDAERITMLPTNECIGLANSPMEHPFQKVLRGRKMFSNIIKDHSSFNQKKYLIDNLLRLLSDSIRVQPDFVLESAGVLAGASRKALDAYSAINIYSPEERLASRTSTVILVDSHGKVDFVEKNIDFTSDPENPAVSIHRKSFPLAKTILYSIEGHS